MNTRVSRLEGTVYGNDLYNLKEKNNEFYFRITRNFIYFTYDYQSFRELK